MAASDNNRADQLAREIRALTGESLTDVVVHALEERLNSLRRERGLVNELEAALALVKQFDTLPVRDTRPADEILGYDKQGVPK
ncbi:MAG: type II toxin-antitoxin system VapB family antitoxin [Myxococcota bacterium]